MHFNYDLQDLDKALSLKNQNRILIFDSIYLSKFPQNQKTQKILQLENSLKEEIKFQARLINTNKQIKSEKNILLQQILTLSNKIYKNIEVDEDLDFTDQMLVLKNRVKEINSQIDENEKTLSELPQQIQNTNTCLLKEIILQSYQIMVENDNIISSLNPEIEELRVILRQKIDELESRKEVWKDTFNLINNLSGQEVIDYLDLNFKP